MADMLKDYLPALRELQTSGPYHLAGWSTGGTFAFALAEALERAGEQVGLIALLDSPLPSVERKNEEQIKTCYDGPRFERAKRLCGDELCDIDGFLNPED